MQSKPNVSHVVGQVESRRLAEDGWGAWAVLDVISTSPVPGAEDLSGGLAGTTVEVFVPPPLLDAVTVGARYEGELTVRSGPRGANVYALVPEPARKSKRR